MNYPSHFSPDPAAPTRVVARTGFSIARRRARHRRPAPLPRHRAVPAGAARPAHRMARRRRWPRVLAGVLCVGLVLTLVCLLGAGPAAAAPGAGTPSAVMLAGKDKPPADVDLKDVVNNATNWLIGILATVATFFLTLGGARYLSAGGDPSEVERAKGALKNAGIGYALALLAPAILKILQSILSVQP